MTSEANQVLNDGADHEAFSWVAGGPISRLLAHPGLTGPDQLAPARAAIILTGGVPMLAVIAHQIPMAKLISWMLKAILWRSSTGTHAA